MKVTVVISVWRGVFDEVKVFRDSEVAQKYAEKLKKASNDQDFDVTVTTIDIIEVKRMLLGTVADFVMWLYWKTPQGKRLRAELAYLFLGLEIEWSRKYL